MRTFTRLFCLSALAASIFVSGCGGSSSSSNVEVLYVLSGSGDSLRQLPLDTFVLGSIVNITGLQGGEVIQAIDVRPLDGTLFGLSNLGQLYTINASTGAATAVGTPITLAGIIMDIDFNPTVDRIRVTTTSGENLRLNPDTGAIASTDTNFAYGVGDINEGNSLNVAGAAYSNNVAGAATTTLYGLEAAQDYLVIVNPPNAGTLNSVAASTPAGFQGDIGLDISGSTGIAYVLNSSNTINTIDLATADMSTLTIIPGSARDIAVKQ
jgi:hypothetical protein